MEGMKSRLNVFLTGMILPFAAFAANEGVPSYYQTSAGPNANQIGYGQYSQQGYSKYVGTSGQKQVVGTRSTSYQVPRASVAAPTNYGTMTANGIAVPADSEHRTNIYAGYSRRFADFEFKTGVNSILEWAYGKQEHGGLSMDYDLEPYDSARPEEGIFTISIGNQSGTSNHFKFGIGAHHIWDIGGWKLSPSIGYEIFKHDLKMSDHYYPNPGIYLPLLTVKGDYVYGDAAGNYYAFPQGVEAPDDLYQVCMSPEVGS